MSDEILRESEAGGGGTLIPWTGILSHPCVRHPLTRVSSGQTWPLRPGDPADGQQILLVWLGSTQGTRQEGGRFPVEGEGMCASVWFCKGQSSRRVLPLADI